MLKLGAEYRRVLEKLRRLEAVIDAMEAVPLRAVETALLAKYRDGRARLEFEREKLWMEIVAQNCDQEYGGVVAALSDEIVIEFARSNRR